MSLQTRVRNNEGSGGDCQSQFNPDFHRRLSPLPQPEPAAVSPTAK